MASTYIRLPVEQGGGPSAGVDSFNGRTGVVVSQAGDYSAGIVSNTPAGNISATNVQSAINELDSEKQATITGAASSVVTADLPADVAVVSTGLGKIGASSTTAVEIARLSGVTSSVQGQLNAKQPLDANLTAISALATSGIMIKTGPGSVNARDIVAGSSAVTVTNGSGITGNPTIDLPNTGVSAGSYGSATQVSTVTVDAKGKVTAASNTSIAIPSTQVTNFTTAAQTAAVQNNLLVPSTVKAPSVDAVNTALAAVLINPMTTDGDMIYYDTGNQRLPIGNENDILRTVGGFPSWEAENLTQDFGDGSDGNLNLTGALTLTQIPYYDTLTIGPGAVLNTNGYPIYCKTLDLTNAPAGSIIRNGAAGTNASSNAGAAGAGSLAAAVLGQSGAGSTGATGQNNAGAQAGAPTNQTPANGGAGGAAGASGAGGTGAAAGAAAGATVSNYLRLGRFEYQFLRGATQIIGGAGGRGGASDGGDGANASRGGGGGGAGGGVLVIYAANIITSGSTASAVVQAKGGQGGRQINAPAAGSCGGAGGAGGGGGGYIYLTYVTKSGPSVSNLLDASGGNGGDGSIASGTGIGGNGGTGGNGGNIQTYNVTTGLGVQILGSAGSAGTAGSGINGGVGGAGGTCVLSL